MGNIREEMPAYTPETANSVLLDTQQFALSWVKGTRESTQRMFQELNAALELDPDAAPELVAAQEVFVNATRDIARTLKEAFAHYWTTPEEPPVPEGVYIARWTAWNWLHFQARWRPFNTLRQQTWLVLNGPKSWPERDEILLQKLWEIKFMLECLRKEPGWMMKLFKDVRIPYNRTLDAMYLCVALFRKERSEEAPQAGDDFEYHVGWCHINLKVLLKQVHGDWDEVERWLDEEAGVVDPAWRTVAETGIARYADATPAMHRDMRGV